MSSLPRSILTSGGRRGAVTLLVTFGLLSAPAIAAPRATLEAGLDPLRPNASTTVSIGFQIATDPGQQPPPLTGFAVTLPAGMGFAATTLGLSTCSLHGLLAEGAGACPHDSLMGFGSAQTVVSIGSQLVHETAPMSIFMTQPVAGNTTMLFYFNGQAPVIAPLVLQTEVLTPENSSASELSTSIPVVPTAPGAADVAIVGMRSSLGPARLRYFKHVRGHTVAYRPNGLDVPETCPSGGYVFKASFEFEDGSHTTARSVVPCARRNTSRHKGESR